MKKLLLLSVIFLFQTAQSQVYPGKDIHDFESFNLFEYEFPWMENFTGDQKIKSLIFHELVKHEPSNSYFFNEQGKVVKIENTKLVHYRNPLSRLVVHTQEYEFDNSNRLAESKLYNKKGKILSKKKMEYYSGNRFSSIYTEWKGKPNSKTLYTYGVDSTLMKVEYFTAKDHSFKLYSSYLYTYHPDKTLKSTLYYAKNKLKHKWDFDCDARGKLVKKDTTAVCTSESMDAEGRKIVTTLYTVSKKEQTKTIDYFNLINGKEVLAEREQYSVKNGKETPEFKVHYPDSLEPFYERQSYSTKGKLTSQQTIHYYVYSENMKKLKTKELRWFNRKGRENVRRIEHFNAKGLPEEVIVTDKSEIGTIRYSYTSDHSFTIDHYRKSKLEKSFKAEVAYY